MTADERSFKSFYYWDEGGKLFLLMGIGITVFVSLFIYATARFGFRPSGFVFSWVMVWIFLILGATYVLTAAEVLVNADGIARKVYGWTCQPIKWSDVKFIREYAAQVQRQEVTGLQVKIQRETVTGVRIYPNKCAFWTFRLYGFMVINSRFDEFDELIGILNEQIALHQIKVEVKVSGAWQRRQRLAPTIPPLDRGNDRPLPWKIASFAIPLGAAGILLYWQNAPKGPPILSSSFYGTWTNVNPNFHDWWTISREGVMSYGVDAGGKCIGNRGIVIDREHMNVPFGNAGIVHLRSGEFGTMVFETARGSATHVRVPPDTICRKPGGTYFESAPYPNPRK
jgi:hypothetical protein